MRKWILIGVGALVGLAILGAIIGGSPEGTPTPIPVAGATATLAEATPTPTAVPTPSPGPTPLATLTPIERSGMGNKIVRLELPDKIVIATATHRGEENFVVWALDAAGEQQDLLVNTIGRYAGTVLVGLQAAPAAFQVEADGAWTITVKDVFAAREWDPAGAVEGSADDVIRLSEEVSGFTTVNIAHSGDENFVVWAYTASDRDLLVNEIGQYAGEHVLPSGTFLIVVEADGDWIIAPS